MASAPGFEPCLLQLLAARRQTKLCRLTVCLVSGNEEALCAQYPVHARGKRLEVVGRGNIKMWAVV